MQAEVVPQQVEVPKPKKRLTVQMDEKFGLGMLSNKRFWYPNIAFGRIRCAGMPRRRVSAVRLCTHQVPTWFLPKRPKQNSYIEQFSCTPGTNLYGHTSVDCRSLTVNAEEGPGKFR